MAKKKDEIIIMTNKEIINEIFDEVVETIKYCEEQFKGYIWSQATARIDAGANKTSVNTPNESNVATRESERRQGPPPIFCIFL